MVLVLLISGLLLWWIYAAIWKYKVKPNLGSTRPKLHQVDDVLYVSRWKNEDGEILEFTKPRDLHDIEEERDRRRRVAIAAVDPRILQ